MAQVIVRNLDDDVVERLKTTARAENKSLEQKLREILTDVSRPNKRELRRRAARIRAMSPKTDIDATDLIREDRER